MIKGFIWAGASLLSSAMYAGTMGAVVPETNWTWVGAISGGPVWPSGASAQTLFLTPTILKEYTVDSVSNVLADGELFLGLQRSLVDVWQAQLGLAVMATSNATISGEIWDDADSQFNNFTYHYQLQHTHVALKGKILRQDPNYWVFPWLSLSLGVGFNDMHGFNNTPVIFEAIKNPNFASHTETSFTYTLGLGLQKPISMHWQVGAGYEFTDWGSSHLGVASGQTTSHGPAFNHFYTNGLMFNLTYLG